MKKVRIGSVVRFATNFGKGPFTNGTIENIEICRNGTHDNGRQVKTCDLNKHWGVLDFSDVDHWAYFNQVKSVIKY